MKPFGCKYMQLFGFENLFLGVKTVLVRCDLREPSLLAGSLFMIGDINSCLTKPVFDFIITTDDHETAAAVLIN